VARPILAISGPTACGKTAVGVALARRLGTEIISADSVQVYRRFDIGSAKPSPEQMAQVRHHLVSVVEPEEEYNAASFQQDASSIATALRESGRIPLVVGGTGLYIKALAEGLNLAVKIGPEALTELERIRLEGGQPLLYQRLKDIDPVWAARIHPNDTFRTFRGLGVYLTLGERMSDIFAKNPGRPDWEILTVVLDVPRELLFSRIMARMDAMLAAGWLEEVNMLKEMGYNITVKPMRAVGYRQVFALSQGEMNLAQAKAAIAKGTKALARRQLTWWRKAKGAVTLRLTGDEPAEHIAERILQLDETSDFFKSRGIPL